VPVIIPVTTENPPPQGDSTGQNGNASSHHTAEGMGCSMPNQAVPVSAHPDVDYSQMYRALEERLKVVE
ncbi:hypothetical protein A2U01_0115108, partial [Trifolium medium]|nr:hypothetical protein [Trifolium medium]